MAATATGTKHTCNPDRPGFALPFGRRDPAGECLRCRELDEGAAPRTLAWVEQAQQRATWERQDRETIRRNLAAGLCSCGQPREHGVCTAWDW